jgi:pimeloyl-ACP methyl ester carboxylesterase
LDAIGPLSEVRTAAEPDQVLRLPSGASAARSYWEAGRAQALAGGQPPPRVSIPVGYTTFPDEIVRAPRSWVEKGYPALTYFHEAAKGGHFAAWEVPELFREEIRAAFKSLR